MLPEVPSYTVPPGSSFPLCSASRIMPLAILSLEVPPTFINSHFAKMVHPVAPESVCSLSMGVSPIKDNTESWTSASFYSQKIYTYNDLTFSNCTINAHLFFSHVQVDDGNCASDDRHSCDCQLGPTCEVHTLTPFAHDTTKLPYLDDVRS